MAAPTSRLRHGVARIVGSLAAVGPTEKPMSNFITGEVMKGYLERFADRCNEVQARNPDMTKQQVIDFVMKEMRG